MAFGDLLAKLPWLPAEGWYGLRDLMRLPARVRDPADGAVYRFHGDSFEAWKRGMAFLGKEPETIAWLRDSLTPGDVFLDIGANVGVFTLFAARRVGDAGHVCAIEPHLPTATQLLRNVALNGLGARVSVLTVAAAAEDGFVPFRYKRFREGSSGSQLGIAGAPEMALSSGTELKFAVAVDSLVARGVIRPPTLVKIDVDGIEAPILRGMALLMAGADRPRAILVEMTPGAHAAQVALMADQGYRLAATHVLGKWRREALRGAGTETLAANGVFVPAGRD
jgi:FkbM family methyltransferase